MRAVNDNNPTASSIRFPVQPRLVPMAKAARRLHLTPAEFEAKAGDLHQYGFPTPCPVTGHYDLKAIDAWLDRRAGLLDKFGPANTLGQARNAAEVVPARIANG